MAILSCFLGPDARRRAETSDALARKGGFGPAQVFTLGDAVIAAHPALDGSGLQHATDGQNAAIAVGRFCFRGTFGTKGLRAFLAQTDRHPPSLEGCTGHFALALLMDGHLSVMMDSFGSIQMYTNEGMDCVSTSFLALFDAGRPSPDPLGVYQYAFDGCGYGGTTLATGVRSLHRNTYLQAVRGETFETHPVVPPTVRETPPDPSTNWAKLAVERLTTVFDEHCTGHGGRLEIGLTGGLDSRLLLSAARRCTDNIGTFVYGSNQDADVQIAELVAARANVPLRTLDKASWPAPDLNTYADEFLTQAIAYDGWANGSIINGGHDHAERRARAAPGDVVVNGGLGEVMRNFFSLPERMLSATDLYNQFFAKFDPAVATSAFDEPAYRDYLISVMNAATQTDSPVLSRAQAEIVYPRVRGRWWTARELSVSARFTEHLFPFLDDRVIAGFEHMPVALKNSGRIQCDAICELAPDLAELPTGYGFTPQAGPSLAYRAKSTAKLYFPLAARREIIRTLYRRGPTDITPKMFEVFASVIDPSFPVMGEYFRTGDIRSADTLGRVAVMEWLFSSSR